MKYADNILSQGQSNDIKRRGSGQLSVSREKGIVSKLCVLFVG